MDFGGDLSVLEPSMVFQMLNMSGLTGVLKFITLDNVSRFYIRDGELLYATIETRRKKIGKFLIEKEFITAEQLDQALEEFKTSMGKERIGHILIKRGYLDYESLVAAIQDQMKEVVFETLQWNRGQFVFFANVLPEDEDILLDVKMDHLILEGLKRIDESKET
jgi:hypothetical protein